MKKIIQSILIFAACCALPFLGLWLTRLAYDFNPNDGFAGLIAVSVVIGIIASVTHYEN